MAGTLEIPSIGSENLTADPKIKKAMEVLNGLLNEENKIVAGSLAAAARPVTWYTPKVIATEESRTNTAFGTLATADEIKEVVVPENGLLVIGYQALWKQSVLDAGRAAIFIGENQLKVGNFNAAAGVEGAEAEFNVSSGTGLFAPLSSCPEGLNSEGPAITQLSNTTNVTTGQALASPVSGTDSKGGLCHVFVAAGTYNVSVRFKSSSGSVTAKERKLWVYVLGS